MNTTTEVKEAIIEYNDYLFTKSKDLIKFSEEYQSHIPRLLEFVKKREGGHVRLPFVRMNTDGSLMKKTMNGLVKKVENTSFIFSVKETLDDVTYEDSRDIFVRTDNILGAIPVMPGEEDMNVFENSPTETTLKYFSFLEKTKKLMISCIGVTHAATLYWWYDEKYKVGNYKTEGQIVKVNKSNVEYDCVRVCAPGCIDITPHSEISRFIAPYKYLKGFGAVFGVSHQINACDNE